ncbi:unnamed protein product [Macrosiphum euphorbiae]|uniref:Tc1-like transposase DDE domain-containing protein n=1 Tax=Macrosiphum euphorbiae TaxID=13131 RepID=A0AAV0XTC6_9HEMI|nr:unnamed protein product [Macrosiphum euphorbiae]
MDGDTFFDWLKNVLPLLDDNCVIVMDNASYHSVKSELCPTLAWKKCDIEKWLEEKGETFERPIIKPRLMEIVNRIKPQYNSYVIDEYVKSHGKEKEEERFWEIDFVVDDVLESMGSLVLTITGDTSNSESEEDSF